MIRTIFGLGLGLVVSQGATEERKAPTSSQIEASAVFDKAPITNLEAVENLKYVAPEQVPLTTEIKAEGEAKLRLIAEKLGIPITNTLMWYPSTSSTSVYHRSSDGGNFSLWFDGSGRKLRSVRVFSLPVLDEIRSRVTADSFEEYAKGFYLRAFGEAPSGRAVFQWDGEGIHRFGKESVAWRLRSGGVMMNKRARFSVDRDAHKRMTVFCTMGPTHREMEQMETLLKKRPVRITHEEAMAIAWKNWKNLRTDGYGEKDFTVNGYLREMEREELTNWNHGRFETGERRAWQDPEFDAKKSDLIYYDIQLNDGLFQVDVLVDRESGAVVRMHQGRMSW